MITLGVLAAGGAAFFALRDNEAGSASPTENVTTPSLITPVSAFPIRRGATGQLVKNIQAALARIGGVPKNLIYSTGGIDGKYGPGTQGALEAAGFPTTISEATYKKIISVQGNLDTTAAVGQKAASDATFGATIYQTIGKSILGGYSGQNRIASVPNRTGLGRVINQTGNMILLETTLNGKVRRFWTEKDDVKLYSSNEFDNLVATGYLKGKSSSLLNAISRFFG